MRPQILSPFFFPLARLKGVGEATARRLKDLVGEEVIDLLFTPPRRYIERTLSAPPYIEGTCIIAHVQIKRHRATPKTHILEGDHLSLLYFHTFRHFERMFTIGQHYWVSGTVSFYRGTPVLVHPEYVRLKDDIPRLEPLYPLSKGVSNKLVGSLLKKILLTSLTALPEWINTSLMRQYAWPSWDMALRQVHAPRSISTPPLARARLAYDELLAYHLALLVSRTTLQKEGRALPPSPNQHKLVSSLPFHLTESQKTALQEIHQDMCSPHRMLRLLQGDVGSGKTIVALLALDHTVCAGEQAAFMAPTTLLAQQHMRTTQSFLKERRVVLLTSALKGKKRQDILAQIASGEAHIVIGTHALFQEEVRFQRLGCVVIDEQHRFGVIQRLALSQKHHADILLMTATPIPRTLMMSLYGDITVSRLTEKPAGRHPIVTAATSTKKLPDVIGRLKQRINQGEKAYWVCPRIEESDTLDITPVTQRAKVLRDALGETSVVMVHGDMKEKEREKAMLAFVHGEATVLVATTVIEVGLDVPEASIMVIEHAERFGLAQLHQLRGRIGRGTISSRCLLLHTPHLTPKARQRLQTIVATEDGFVIAEKDMALRGSGDVLSTQQSGFPSFRFVDFDIHQALFPLAAAESERIIQEDPTLTGCHKHSRYLLHLFRKEALFPLITSG